jgi:hypothetical protein
MVHVVCLIRMFAVTLAKSSFLDKFVECALFSMRIGISDILIIFLNKFLLFTFEGTFHDFQKKSKKNHKIVPGIKVFLTIFA